MNNKIKCTYCGEFYSALLSRNLDGIPVCPFCNAVYSEIRTTELSLDQKLPEFIQNHFQLLSCIGEFAHESINWDEIQIIKFGMRDKQILEDIAEFLENLNLSEKIQLGNAMLWYRLGRMMETFDDVSNALIYYHTAFTTNESLDDALWNYGILNYYENDNVKEALLYLEKAISINHGTGLDREDYELLSEMYESVGNMEKSNYYLNLMKEIPTQIQTQKIPIQKSIVEIPLVKNTKSNHNLNEILEQISILTVISELGNEQINWEDIDLSTMGNKDHNILKNLVNKLDNLSLIEKRILGYPILWYRLARIMEELDAPDSSIILYQVSIINDDSFADAWFNLGVLLYYDNQNNQQALQCMEKTLSLTKGQDFADEDWFLVAEMYNKIGNKEKANFYLKKIKDEYFQAAIE